MGICLFLAVSCELEYASWTLSLPGSDGLFQLHEHKLFLLWLTLWLGISGKISTLITLTWPGSFLVYWVPPVPALWVSLQEAGSLGKLMCVGSTRISFILTQNRGLSVCWIGDLSPLRLSTLYHQNSQETVLATCKSGLLIGRILLLPIAMFILDKTFNLIC